MSMSFVLVDGPNNGSCISLLGNNRSIVPVRKMPIVGDTGEFLLTDGYAIAQMHRADFKSGDAIVGCNISHANSMSPIETGTLSLTTISTTETSGLDNQTSFSCRPDNINAVDHSGSPNLFHADLHATSKHS
ncbi:hypothetical protein WN943_006719 [Citrus x changshan-huyou]